MSTPSEPKRRYDSRHRQERARASRGAVLEAARTLFLEQGYASTTLAQIAEAADVSVPTVYKAFANKAGLLKAVFDVAVAGDDDPVPMAERPAILAVIAEPDAGRKIALYTRDHAARARQSVPVQLLARDAGAADPDAAAVWSQTRSELLDGMAQFARDLARTGKLRVSAGTARDVLWTFYSPELYELLVLERHWSPNRYRSFVENGVVAALLS